MLAATLAITALTVPAAAFAADAPGTTQLVSTSSAGEPGNNDSQLSSISADGRFVAFTSIANNLVPGDTNDKSDVFVRDRQTGATERVSVSNNGRQGDGDSGFLQGLGGPSISADGRFVAFDSLATNLVNQDKNNAEDVFVRDRVAGTTTRVSVSSTGAEESGRLPRISGDGRYVAFLSVDPIAAGDTNFTDDVYVHDRQTGVTEWISHTPDGSAADGQSLFAPRLSADGRFVYFSSFAGNLTAVPDQGNSDVDAFLFDRQSGVMSAVTGQVAHTGTLEHGVAEGISPNGRFLTFTTADTNFVSPDANGFSRDAFLVERSNLDARTLLSVNDAGQQGDNETFAGPVSNDGRFAALVSEATNFGGPTQFRDNVYLRDVVAGTTRLVSAASPGGTNELNSNEPSMTPDGSAVSFTSASELLGPENQGFFASDIFVRDLARADLALTMDDSPDPVRVRGQLTYSLTVRNGGSASASNVTLADTLPAATFVSATPAQGTCVRGGKGKTDGTLTCQLGSLGAGQTTTVTVVVSPTKVGSLSNTATVSADEIDPDTANNSATATTTVTR